MVQIFGNISNIGKTTIPSLLFLVAVLSTLTGCAAVQGKKSSGVVTSREATDIWHSYEILPNYHYYTTGPQAQPNYIIGIDDQYHLTSNLWKPVDLTPEMLYNWINYKRPRVGYSVEPYGAFITGPHGERIGLWYSVHDWRLKGSASVGENNQISVIRPVSGGRRGVRGKHRY